MKQKKVMLLIVAGVIILLLSIIGLLGWKYYEVSKSQKENPSAVSDKIIKQVSSIYLLPPNEVPTVAVIQDKNKLGNQEFFKDARDGDYLLLYSKSQLALVYRESARKLITVGSLNIQNNNQTAGAAAQ